MLVRGPRLDQGSLCNPVEVQRPPFQGSPSKVSRGAHISQRKNRESEGQVPSLALRLGCVRSRRRSSVWSAARRLLV